MSWEISITAEGWQEIREELEKWTKEDLISALAEEGYSELFEDEGYSHNEAITLSDKYEKQMEILPHDVLVAACCLLIQKTNTCDNGGYFYWIDRNGWYKVELKDKED